MWVCGDRKGIGVRRVIVGVSGGGWGWCLPCTACRMASYCRFLRERRCSFLARLAAFHSSSVSFDWGGEI